MKVSILSPDRVIRTVSRQQWLILIMRLSLGSIFILSSISKLSDHAKFIDVVVSYNILPTNVAEFYGIVLPWTEFVIGALLIIGLFSRLAATISIPLVISFVIANIYGMIGNTAKCGENYCGCFGETLPMSSTSSLILDIVMLLLATSLVAFKSRLLSTGHWISMGGSNSEQMGFIDSRVTRLSMVLLAVVASVLVITVLAEPNIHGTNSHAANSDTEVHLAINNLLETGNPVLVFFHKEDCEFCEAQKPIVDELEQEYGDGIGFVRINGTDNPEVIQDFNLGGFPSIVLISGMDVDNEYEQETFLGFMEKDTLQSRLDSLIQNGEIDDDYQSQDDPDTDQSPWIEGQYCGADSDSCPDDSDTPVSNIHDDIDKALTSGKLALVLFHADDCDFCQDQELIVDQLEFEYSEFIAFLQVDADDHPENVQEFGVSTYPSMFLISDECAEDQYTYELFEGFTGIGTLQENIDSLLGITEPESQLQQDINEALDSGKPVFVLFHADDCDFCQDQELIADQLQLEYSEYMVFLQCDADDNPSDAQDFGISTYPSILLISDKDNEDQYTYELFEGFTGIGTLQENIDSLLGITEPESQLQQDINEALDSGKPAFVLFHADDCDFCQDQELIIDQLLLEYSEYMVFLQCDADDNPSDVQDFGISIYPSMLLISDKDDEDQYVYDLFEDLTGIDTLRISINTLLGIEPESQLRQDIDEALDTGKPVFVLFHADDCDFCQEQAIIVDQLELDYGEHMVFLQCDADDNPLDAQYFGISTYPTMSLISDKDTEGQYTYELFEGYTKIGTLQDRILSLLIYEALDSGKYVFLYFGAEWCSVCQDQKLIVDELEQQYSDQVMFIDIDIDTYPGAAEKFNVSSYPTMFLISGYDGEGDYIYELFEGYHSKSTLQQSIDALLQE